MYSRMLRLTAGNWEGKEKGERCEKRQVKTCQGHDDVL